MKFGSRCRYMIVFGAKRFREVDKNEEKVDKNEEKGA
jgi:hypothetical protein